MHDIKLHVQIYEPTFFFQLPVYLAGIVHLCVPTLHTQLFFNRSIRGQFECHPWGEIGWDHGSIVIHYTNKLNNVYQLNLTHCMAQWFPDSDSSSRFSSPQFEYASHSPFPEKYLLMNKDFNWNLNMKKVTKADV